MDAIQEVFGATTIGLTACLVLGVFLGFLYWFSFVVRRRSGPGIRLPQWTAVLVSVLISDCIWFWTNDPGRRRSADGYRDC